MTAPQRPQTPARSDTVVRHVAAAVHHYLALARRERRELPAEFRAFAEIVLGLADVPGGDSAGLAGTRLDPPGCDQHRPGLTEAVLLRIDDVAFGLGVSDRTVKRLIERGDLPVVRIGTATRVPRAALDAYVASLMPVQAPSLLGQRVRHVFAPLSGRQD